MYKVYGDILSGNCYKIKLLLTLLDVDHEWIHIDILKGETHTDSFKSMNENAKIPILQINSSEYLTESNAILNFLAEGTEYLPASGIDRARVLQWQFFEQYSHEPYIAVARYIHLFLGLPENRKEEYLSKQEGGHKALLVMDKQLSKDDFFVGSKPTIADISLYAYTHVASEGGFELEDYTNVKAWLNRIESLPGYISMSKENA